jgi:hypothetical protein
VDAGVSDRRTADEPNLQGRFNGRVDAVEERGHGRDAPKADGLAVRLALIDVPAVPAGLAVQAAGTQDQGFVKSFGGLNVILDSNVRTLDGAATNQDEVYVLHLGDMFLMEGDVLAVTFEDVLSANMNVRLRLNGFSFWLSGREPPSICTTAGTGLAAPVFAG